MTDKTKYDQVLQARVPQWLHDAVQDAADEKLISKSDVVRAILLREFPLPDKIVN